jgi:uncharacterized RDD family membrane protein YckC
VDDRFLIQTAQNVELALAPAGVGDRILAWLADVAVWAGYALLVGFTLSESGAPEGAVLALVVLPVALYDLAFEVLFEGQTPGKMLLRLRVARLDGAQPTLGQYALRWLLRWVDVTASSGTVAVLAISLSPRQQRLGDVAAGTTVVRQRRRVRLDEVLYPEPPPGYTPRFPEAARLSDADVRTLRAVLVRHRLSTRDVRGRALADRAKAAVEARLGLDPVGMPADEFLTTVVRDHTFVLDRGLGTSD